MTSRSITNVLTDNADGSEHQDRTLNPGESNAGAEDDSENNVALDSQLAFEYGRLSLTTTGGVDAQIQDPANEDSGNIHQQSQSRLFQLPIEIRLHIYELIFRVHTEGRSVVVMAKDEWRDETRKRTPSVLTALLTCRKFLAEAEGIFYSIHRFSGNSGFISSLGPRRRAAVTMATCTASVPADMLLRVEALRLLAPNLKSLHLYRRGRTELLGAYDEAEGIKLESWAIVGRRMVKELEWMECLEEVKIFCRVMEGVRQGEMAGKEEFDAVDRMLYAAIRGSRK